MMNERKKSDAIVLDLYCVRHGQAGNEHAWKYDQEKIRQAGLPLSTLGKRQSLALGAYLSDIEFDHVYTSDLLRAYETTTAIAEQAKELSMNVLPALREVNAWHIEGGRKPSEDQVQRECKRVEECVQLLRTYQRGEKVLLVAHGNILRFLLARLAGVDPRTGMHIETSNASLTRVYIDESGRMRIQETNNVSFLKPEERSHI